MRKKDISDAIGNINDRYIEEAADFQIGKKGVRKHFIMRRAVAAAATIMLLNFSIRCLRQQPKS